LSALSVPRSPPVATQLMSGVLDKDLSSLPPGLLLQVMKATHAPCSQCAKCACATGRQNLNTGMFGIAQENIYTCVACKKRFTLCGCCGKIKAQ
jgi:hypothetical protein